MSLLRDRQTAEAIQLRLEYNPAPPFNAGSPDTAPPEILALMKEKIAPSQARRVEKIGRAAARLNRDRLGRINAAHKKKAAWFPKRPFLSHGGHTLAGRSQNVCTGGLSPGRILIGGRCKSGQSRLEPDTDAMVSHLRKMTLLSRNLARMAQQRAAPRKSPLFPLFTGNCVAAPISLA